MIGAEPGQDWYNPRSFSLHYTPYTIHIFKIFIDLLTVLVYFEDEWKWVRRNRVLGGITSGKWTQSVVAATMATPTTTATTTPTTTTTRWDYYLG